jgi:hypothetical protein
MPSDVTDQLFLSVLNNPRPHFAMEVFGWPSSHDVEWKQFQRLLRSYVDEWIDTGVSEDGTEDLTERGLLRKEWFERGQVLTYANNKLNALDMAQMVVLEVFRQNTQTILGEDGVEIVFPAHEPKLEHAPLSDLVEREAKRFFVWFLASELRSKLGKCRVCNHYEIKTRKFYKRGTHCRGCMATKSAGQITQKKRQDLHRKRIETLATVLKSHSERINLKDLATRKQLAHEVNLRLRSERGISSKWVKRNLNLIERGDRL